MIVVPIKRIDHGLVEPLGLPEYATEHAAGLDLMAAVRESVCLKPLGRALIPTGIAVALPRGFMADIRPRSGLALKYGISIVNAPGTIDCDYRGEIAVILINLGAEDFVVETGMRIAQMVIIQIPTISLTEVDQLPQEILNRDGSGQEFSVRGVGGFGSTGL